MTDRHRSPRLAFALAFALAHAACDRGATPTDASPDARADAMADVAVLDAPVADAPRPDAPPADAPPPGTCVRARGAATPGSDVFTDGAERATVSVDDEASCARAYTLATTARLRDNQPGNPRRIAERAGAPTVRTRSLMFDALYALALEEARENSVASIRDGAFDDGAPRACPAGGCFETGRLWTYAWTRDTAYAVDLGLGALDPTRARNTLEFKLSPRRAGGDLQIVQDTGTGGSYPVSTDRVVWALGAWTLLAYLDGAERDAFAARAFDAIRNTVEHDRAVAFDPVHGLYAGEQSFLDWREQSYPAWTANDVVHVGMSRALSTNVAHYAALDVAARLAQLRGDEALRRRYADWAAELRAAINARLFLPERGLYSAFLTTFLDPSPAQQFDLLGNALAVLTGVADEARARQVLARYPHAGRGPAVLWPQQQDTAIYHNRGTWPFVTAYWLRAARRARNDAAVNRGVAALVRGAALHLSNMENFEFVTGASYVDEGPTSGPVVNSQRQLWSVAGYLAMVHDVLFGLEASTAGVRFLPYVTRELRATTFAGADSLVLNDFPYRGRRITVVVALPPRGASRAGAYAVGAIRLNGEVVTQDFIPPERLRATNTLEVALEDRAEAASAITVVDDTRAYRNVFGPRPPAITDITLEGDRVRLALDRSREAPGDVTFNVYRDGRRVATGLSGAIAAWVDPDSADHRSVTHCYAAETVFVASGNASQHSPPRCYWGPRADRVRTVLAYDFQNTGGAASTNHGRFHFEGWGDEGHALVVPYFRPDFSGDFLLQFQVGNGAGPINTGITAAVKRLRVEELPSGAVVAEGYVVAPHAARWSEWRDSSFVRARLDAARTYRVTLGDAPRAVNMSAFSHFAGYTGGAGGRAGAFNRVNVAELRVLPLTGLPSATGARVAIDGATDFDDFAAEQRSQPEVRLEAWDQFALDWDADYVYVAVVSRAFEAYPDRPFVLYVQSSTAPFAPPAARAGIAYAGQTPTVPFEADYAIAVRRTSDLGDGAGPWNGVFRYEGGRWTRALRFEPGRTFFVGADAGRTLSFRIARSQLGLPSRVRVAGHVVSGGGNYHDVVPGDHQPWQAGRTQGFFEIDLAGPTPVRNWVRR